MKWEKLGNVFSVDHNHTWMKSHASNPVAAHLYDNVYRIYFSCRDQHNRSSIGFVEIDLKDLSIKSISDQPVLGPGETGTFDDSGTTIGCIVNVNQKKYLYYIGWNLGVTVPWRNSIGLAIYNEESNHFEKVRNAPIMDRSHIDPYSMSYPFVLNDEGKLKMWYGSNLSWGKSKKEMAHVIKYAESNDGFHWIRKGNIALNFKNEKEYALSRPFILKEDDVYKMWYSYRGDAYRIGYAESYDGITWRRLDDIVGIDISDTGWDSEMIEYPFVFDHNSDRYMLYNGNSFGKTGFGLAILKEKS